MTDIKPERIVFKNRKQKREEAEANAKLKSPKEGVKLKEVKANDNASDNS